VLATTAWLSRCAGRLREHRRTATNTPRSP
jgi:hypothetical protein